MAKKQAEERASAQPSTGSKHEVKKDKSNGRFLPGNRSGGRPKMPEDLKKAFKEACPDALRVLVKIVNDEDAKHGDRIRAAEVILDRGYGKPVQAVDLDAATIPQVVILGDVPD